MIFSVVGTYEPYLTKISLHFTVFVLIYTRIWWTSNLHGNSPVGVVYTMNHEVVPRPCKTCDWLLNSSWDYFSLRQGKKMSEWPWSSRSPRNISKGLHCPVTWFNGFCGGRGKRGALVKKKGRGPWQRSVVIVNLSWNLFEGKGRWSKRRQENGQIRFFFFSKLVFLDTYLKKTSTFTFWCMVIPLGPHSVYT